MSWKKLGLLCGLFCFLGAPLVFGQDQGGTFQMLELKEENARLKERVETLEKSLGEIKDMISQKSTEKAAAPVEEKKPAKKDDKVAMKSKYGVDFYGYFKLDMAQDDSAVNIGNFVRWVPSEATKGHDSHFFMSANSSRFGFNFKGPEAGKAKVSGNYEFDLFSNAAPSPENSAIARTRHAFLQVDWPEEDISLIGGQTWDLVGMQNPTQLNYPASWWAGNIGFRHPQLRISKGFKTGDKSKLLLQLAAVRNIGDTGALNLANTDTGSDSGHPSVQGRVSLTFPTTKNLKATIGVFGHKGRDEVDYNNKGDSTHVDTNSIGTDINIPFTDKIAVKGELWKGENLDDFFGGIGQGIILNSASGTYVISGAYTYGGVFNYTKPIKSQGGWWEFNFGPFAKWRYNVGLGVDNPDDDILPNGARAKNTSKWLNAMYDLNEAVQIGLEYSRWETEYKNGPDGNNTRLQSALIYKF